MFKPKYRIKEEDGTFTPQMKDGFFGLWYGWHWTSYPRWNEGCEFSTLEAAQVFLQDKINKGDGETRYHPYPEEVRKKTSDEKVQERLEKKFK